MTTCRSAGPGILDRPVVGRETLAGVLVGNDRTIILEVEEQRLPNRPSEPREYAEVPFTIAGATKLRDALDNAIRMAQQMRGPV